MLSIRNVRCGAAGRAWLAQHSMVLAIRGGDPSDGLHGIGLSAADDGDAVTTACTLQMRHAQFEGADSSPHAQARVEHV
eukprot:6192870-Pleurochrysis_carterae.AAC.3